MLDPNINITGSKTGSKLISLSLPDTVKPALMISLPSSRRQAGRAGTSIETINRTICLFLNAAAYFQKVADKHVTAKTLKSTF